MTACNTQTTINKQHALRSILINPGYVVACTDERSDVSGEADAAVLGEVEDVPFSQLVIFFHTACLQEVIEIDGDGFVRIVLMDEENFLLRSVPCEAFGGADRINDAVTFGELVSARFLHFPEDEDTDGAELHNIDSDVRSDIVAGEPFFECGSEFGDSHALRVDFSDKGKRDFPIRTHEVG